ncbi:MAG: hypothetical protein HY964_07410 [Ignavibacteriales bacterium]|nr:hypothetical protein [Ignavibacteriales bacterium]
MSTNVKIPEEYIYKTGSKYAIEQYRRMAAYNVSKNAITQVNKSSFGKSKKDKNNKGGTAYAHLLNEEMANQGLNFLFPKIFEGVKKRFAKDTKVDYSRILNNLCASTPCCCNLFVPLQQDKELTRKLFSILLKKELTTITKLVIEFTPHTSSDNDESIGDQGRWSGTDADVRIDYNYGNNQKGLLLIEFKYIESEFSNCGRKKKHANCHSNSYYSFNDCSYRKPRYKNWELTLDDANNPFNVKSLKSQKSCPFEYSLNQLWRNMLLAYQTSKANEYDEYLFGVISLQGNEVLWKVKKENTEEKFRKLLKDKSIFIRWNLEDVVQTLEQFSETDKNWLKLFKEKYLL